MSHNCRYSVKILYLSAYPNGLKTHKQRRNSPSSKGTSCNESTVALQDGVGFNITWFVTSCTKGQKINKSWWSLLDWRLGCMGLVRWTQSLPITTQLFFLNVNKKIFSIGLRFPVKQNLSRSLIVHTKLINTQHFKHIFISVKVMVLTSRTAHPPQFNVIK